MLATYGGTITLENNVLIGRNSTIFGHGKVVIGKYSMISPHCVIVSNNHVAALGETSFQQQGFTADPIIIGENVWLGSHVVVLAGTTIEPNVVVSAGTVVNSNLKTGFLYGGVPAKQIKPLESKLPQEAKVLRPNWGLFD
jgi:acetyltransferase-like isoleucine patch superfamily enzyme